MDVLKSTPLTLKGADYWDSNFPVFVTRERERFLLPSHDHDFVEIHYVAEGKGHHYIGDERFQAEKGDLFIIPIGTAHVYRPSSEATSDELIVYNCLFANEATNLLNKAYPLPDGVQDLLNGKSRAYRRYKDSFHEGRMLMEALLHEYSTKLPGQEAGVYALLTRLLIYLYRLDLKDDSALPVHSYIRMALAFIEDNYERHLTLAEIALFASVSPAYLQKIFKRTTGQTFTEYIQNLRIERSTELLVKTSLSIKEIANKVGYRDMKFFHALFQKKTGCTPNRYRRKGQGEGQALNHA